MTAKKTVFGPMTTRISEALDRLSAEAFLTTARITEGVYGLDLTVKNRPWLYDPATACFSINVEASQEKMLRAEMKGKHLPEDAIQTQTLDAKTNKLSLPLSALKAHPDYAAFRTAFDKQQPERFPYGRF